ncbi:MAG: glycosyltransferase [Blastocatellales bacterium]
MQRLQAWFENKQRAAKNLAFLYTHGRRFKKLEESIHPETWARHDELLLWAESKVAEQAINESAQRYKESDDPIVRQGYELAQQVKQKFQGCRRDCHQLRILIHVPPANVSSAYSSLCANFVQAFQFIGIQTRALEWEDNTDEVLERFKPSILLTVDHEGYLNQINWNAVSEYRQSHNLHVGLNASLQEYGNTPLPGRLEWAEQHEISFYYSFKSQEYIEARYQEILKCGYQVFHLEFGANPLLYYPVPGIERDLNYIFLGSTNPDKWPRYHSYLGSLWQEYPGYIDGPWWHLISRFGGVATHRYLCARAKVALNLHIHNQIAWASELNERTYNLAACGVPQLIDYPKILPERFSPESFFFARSPAEYQSNFKIALNDSAEAQRRALQAQKEVFYRHTSFHRTDSFATQLLGSGLLKKRVQEQKCIPSQ